LLPIFQIRCWRSWQFRKAYRCRNKKKKIKALFFSLIKGSSLLRKKSLTKQPLYSSQMLENNYGLISPLLA
jgi:hypothetical protein